MLAITVLCGVWGAACGLYFNRFSHVMAASLAGYVAIMLVLVACGVVKV